MTDNQFNNPLKTPTWTNWRDVNKHVWELTYQDRAGNWGWERTEPMEFRSAVIHALMLEGTAKYRGTQLIRVERVEQSTKGKHETTVVKTDLGAGTQVEYDIDKALTNPIKPLDYLCCPECGSKAIVVATATWQAQSMEPHDEGNDGTLVECQCDSCGRSIWLGVDAFPDMAADVVHVDKIDMSGFMRPYSVDEIDATRATELRDDTLLPQGSPIAEAYRKAYPSIVAAWKHAKYERDWIKITS